MDIHAEETVIFYKQKDIAINRNNNFEKLYGEKGLIGTKTLELKSKVSPENKEDYILNDE